MTPEEKLDILRAVESSQVTLKEALIRLGVPFSTYYRWKANLERHGIEGLRDRSPFKGKTWNEVLPHEQERILEVADHHPEWFSREIDLHISDNDDFTVSESSVYRILKQNSLNQGLWEKDLSCRT